MTDSLTIHDHIDTDRALALAGLLDRERGELVTGASLPLCWHWLYFLERVPQRELGPDGHPLAGFPTPPASGLRRMFAGGRITAHPASDARGLRIGDDAVLQRTVAAQRSKEGRTGPLHFATVRDVVSVGEQRVLTDERDIVYLPASPLAPPAPKLATYDPRLPAAVRRRDVQVDPVLLFRFSALTYNAHRIHYDRDYARDVEGHPGLVIHGPLLALLMAELAATMVGSEGMRRTVRFDYRLVAPLRETDGLHVLADTETGIDGAEGAKVRTQIVDDAGRVTARGTMDVNRQPVTDE